MGPLLLLELPHQGDEEPVLLTIRAIQKMGSAVHFYVVSHVVEPRCGREDFAQWLLPPQQQQQQGAGGRALATSPSKKAPPPQGPSMDPLLDGATVSMDGRSGRNMLDKASIRPPRFSRMEYCVRPDGWLLTLPCLSLFYR